MRLKSNREPTQTNQTAKKSSYKDELTYPNHKVAASIKYMILFNGMIYRKYVNVNCLIES